MQAMTSIPTTDIKTETRVYSDFAGIDLVHNLVNLNRSPEALNVWINYDEEDGRPIETRNGMTLQGDFGGAIYGIHFYKKSDTTYCLIHSGDKLLLWSNYPTLPATTSELKASGMNTAISTSFVFNEILYIRDGLNYLQYDGTDLETVQDNATIPTTSINMNPDGSPFVSENDTSYQMVNLLQPKRKNSFVADGESTEFYLDTQDLDPVGTFVMTAVVNGVNLIETTGFTVDRTLGKVTFSVAPSAPATPGQDNVVITLSKTISGYADRILKCTVAKEFDSRIFFAGNDSYKSYVFSGELNDPTYIGDLNYWPCGTETNKTKALIPGNSVLWVIKEANQNSPSVYYLTPTLSDTYGKIYPASQSNVTTGCSSTGINFGDDIVFMGNEGLKAIASSDIKSENLLGHRSSLIDEKMINDTNFTSCLMEEYKGYLLCLINSHIYLADSRQRWSNAETKSTEYEWYYWELPNTINYFKVYQNTLYLGNADGNVYIYSGATDDGLSISSYWATPHDFFGTEVLQKTTSKKGSISRCSGDVKVSASIDRKEYKEIETFGNVDDYIVFKKKLKKARTISYKLSSLSSMKIYSVTTVVYIGGYIK